MKSERSKAGNSSQIRLKGTFESLLVKLLTNIEKPSKSQKKEKNRIKQLYQGRGRVGGKGDFARELGPARRRNRGKRAGDKVGKKEKDRQGSRILSVERRRSAKWSRKVQNQN